MFEKEHHGSFGSKNFNFIVFMGYLVFNAFTKFNTFLSWEVMKKYH